MALPTVNSFDIDPETFDQLATFSEGVQPVHSCDRWSESICSSPTAIARSNFQLRLFECFEEDFLSRARGVHGREAAWPGIAQTAPDEESEAEWNASLGEQSQVRDLTHGAPGGIRTCDTRFRSGIASLPGGAWYGRAMLFPLVRNARRAI
ncbi:hypothetical protein GCM10022233_68300 [Streptomyces shaanxiensis]|uniref:Uncharacterized protein n=1 Tax=Streptomyces shaanxiensis TaxID=653357 RepID=A0ABP7W1H6_9ACTN